MLISKFAVTTAVAAGLMITGTGVASAAPVEHSTITSTEGESRALGQSVSDEELRQAFDEEMQRQGKFHYVEESRQTSEEAMQQRGLKGAAAKAAIKAAIKALKGIGEKGWNAMLKKLPLPGFIKKYLAYQVVMKALNVAVGFEGEVEKMIENGLKAAGVPGWAAGPASRAIVLFLL